jgi:hypothetical protein
MNKEQAIKEWQYGTQTPPTSCNDYAPDTLAPEPADQENCTTCYHHQSDHMKTPNIITRLTTAAEMFREHEQYNDEPDCNGEALAADACNDAIALIKYLTLTLEEIKEWTLDDEQTIIDHGEPATIDGNMFICAEVCNERFHTIRTALSKINA